MLYQNNLINEMYHLFHLFIYVFIYFINPIKSINEFDILCSLMCNVLFVNILFNVYNLDAVNMLIFKRK